MKKGKVSKNKGFLMNKKGDENLMLKNIIEILLAGIAITLIIFAGVKLFNNYFGKQDDMQAKGALEDLSKKLAEASEEGKIGTIHFQSPAGWYVVAFNDTEDMNGEFRKPDGFFGKNTLCICEKGIKKICKPEICREIKMPLMQG
ncbi:MAG: hypothetical protein WC475_04905, partial [Candidatus Paceibacterota bacterium]